LAVYSLILLDKCPGDQDEQYFSYCKLFPEFTTFLSNSSISIDPLIIQNSIHSTYNASMSIKQEDIKTEEMAIEGQEQNQPRTSRGKHSTPAVEGREAKRISQSNTAFPTHTTFHPLV